MSVWSFLAGLWIGAVIGALAVAFLRGGRGPAERSKRQDTGEVGAQGTGKKSPPSDRSLH